MHPRPCKCFFHRISRTRRRRTCLPSEGDRDGGGGPVVSSVSLLLDALKANGVCRDMDTAKKLHFDAIHCRLHHHVFVATAIATMYARCGCMDSSRRVFDRMVRRDAIAWTALLTGYVINDDFEQALALLPRLQQEKQELCADPGILVALLAACSKLAGARSETSISCLDTGMRIHTLAVSSKLDSTEVFVGSALIDMYVKCGSLLDARMIFDRMDSHDVVAWTSLLLGYAECSNDQDVELALSLFHSMLEVCDPSAHTFVAALTACAALAGKERQGNVSGAGSKFSGLERARAIHALAQQHRVEQETFVAGALVDVYAKCGSMDDARRAFERMPCHNIVVLNSLLLGYVENGEACLVLSILSSSQSDGKRLWSPNHRTLVVALMACSSIGQRGDKAIVGKGMELHCEAAKLGLDISDLFVASTLVDMYASCGSLVDARAVFDRMAMHNVVCWTSLLLGYSENGEAELALELFESMMPNVLPNAKTFRVVLSACANLASAADGGQLGRSSRTGRSSKQCLERGRKIHGQATELGHETDIFVANTLIDMYTKCGGVSDAKSVFESIKQQQRTAVSWHAMILGLVDNEQYQQALDLSEEMIRGKTAGVCPLTIVAALMASSGLARFDSGKNLHSLACRRGYENDASVTSSLIDFYGKCASSMIVANHVFESSWITSLPHWNALIAGYSRHGDTARVFSLLRQLWEEGLHPDEATYLAVLAACSHAGLVDLGTQAFRTMAATTAPGIAHYTCVIDMLGRSNQLQQAVAMIESLPKPSGAGTGAAADAAAWTSVLAACRKWKNVGVAKLAFDKLLKLDEKNASPYLLMANIYGDSKL